MTKRIAPKKYAPAEEVPESDSEEFDDEDGEFDDEDGEFDDEDSDDEPVSDLEEDGDFNENELNEEFDDTQAFDEEAESQVQEEVEEDNQNEQPEAKVIELDSRRLSQLNDNVVKGNIGSIRTVIKIFNSVFSDKKSIATASIYNFLNEFFIHSLKAKIQWVNIFQMFEEEASNSLIL